MHSVSEEKLIEHFGEGCYRKLPDESYKRLRYTPASWTVENHMVEVYAGTDGLRQDEVLRGDTPVVLYEYQKTRHHRHPEEFYRDFKGILVTDGLAQYHLVEDNLEGLINANCWAHARRDFSDAVKAIKDPDMAKRSTAYQALVRIAAIYKPDESLKGLTPPQRLRERQKNVKPLVENILRG